MPPTPTATPAQTATPAPPTPPAPTCHTLLSPALPSRAPSSPVRILPDAVHPPASQSPTSRPPASRPSTAHPHSARPSVLLRQSRLTRHPHLCALALVLLSAGASLMAQSPASQAPLPLDQTLIAADRGLLTAVAGKHPDMDKFAHLLAPEYTDVEQGEVQSRDEVLKIYALLTNFTFAYDDPRAVVLSPTTGYVTANVHYSFPLARTPIHKHKLTTTVFALRQGEWIATLHTESSFENDREDIIAKPEDSLPDLIAMRSLAVDVISQVHIPGYAPFPFFPVSFDAGTAVSFANLQGAHAANFPTLPPPMQQVWTTWASYTQDEPSGEALFKDMFYRFFLVHELGHLIAARVIAGLPEGERETVTANAKANSTENEFVANRIALAWFRDHDPQYLARLVNDFRLIEAQLPSPVPPGNDPKRYLSDNYRKLSSDPMAYGWYQFYMVISVYNEPPKTFQQTLDTLPTLHYDNN